MKSFYHVADSKDLMTIREVVELIIDTMTSENSLDEIAFIETSEGCITQWSVRDIAIDYDLNILCDADGICEFRKKV